MYLLLCLLNHSRDKRKMQGISWRNERGDWRGRKWFQIFAVDERVQGFSCKSHSLEGCTCAVTFCIVYIHVSFIRNVPLIIFFSSFFLVCVCLCVMPNHPHSCKEDPAWEGIASPEVASLTELQTCLRWVSVSVWVVNLRSWKEIMSAIHTLACFLLWISFATQNKTPGKTQIPLCPAASTDP